MNSIKNSNNNLSEKPLSSVNKPTKIVFTIQNGKLLVTSKNNEVSKSAFTGFQSLSLRNSKRKEEGEGEIYIEIIRENVEQSEKCSINNISSSYGAFWKENFELCLERRTCQECGHVLFTPHQLLHHLKNVHHIQNPNECFVCHKLFPNESERTNHLRQIHSFEKPDNTCEACFKVFDSASDKNIHRTHHKERFKCKWCSEPFPCEYLLNCHLRNCSLRRVDLDCHICGCQFRSSHILQLHSLRHNRTSCELCHFSPLNASSAREEDAAVSLVRHLINSHSSEEINNILQKLKIQDKEEETLDKLFMSQITENLNKISESNTQNSANDPANEPCWKITLNDQNEIISKAPEAALQCAECHKTFGSKEETVKHELTHQTPFTCSVCSLKFSHRRGFKKHMRLHGILVKPSSVRYTCRYCSVNCATLSALHTHLLIHTDQKPHLCDKCGLKFRRSNALKAHDLAVHTSRVLHHCPQCDTASLSKASMLRHIQCVHGGVRRFICGICGNRCLQNQGLRRHLKSEHNLEFPPMESLCKKSSMEIHVIPPRENLSSNDPLADILKLAIRDEKSKLEALRKLSTSEKIGNNESHKSSPWSESINDGHSLNILGDVASKAAPLEQANILPEFLQPKSQEATKFLCAGCQYCSDNLNDLSLHLTQCQQGSASFVEQESNKASSAKPPVIYSLASSFARPTNEVSNGIPYHLCFIPPLSVGSSADAILGAVPVTTNNTEHAGAPSINAGTSVPSLLQTPGNLLAASISSTSLGDLNKVNMHNAAEFSENLVPVRDLRLPVDIMSMNALESSHSSQLEFLDSSAFIFQEDYLIREETCKVYDLNESSTSFNTSNTVSLNVSDLESFKQASQQSPLSAVTGLKNTPVLSGVEMSAVLPDNSKHFDNSRSCFAVRTPCNLISSLPAEGVTGDNCGTLVHLEPDNNQPLDDSQNLKFMTSFEKLTTDSSNPTDEGKTSLERDTHSRGTLAKGLHVCSECGKQLSSASTYRRHLEVHFGGKPHKCSYCEKCFRYKHNLTVHIRSHTGARPFKCTVCERKFRYLSELNEHKPSHAGSKSFTCSECGQKFTRQRDLRRHSLSHRKSEKPKCYVCQKTFSRADYLKRHIKSHKPSVIIDDEESLSCETTRGHVMRENRTKTKVQREPSDSAQEMAIISGKSSCASYKSKKTNLSSVGKDCTSDNLITLAYQAAEDGVEFMFVEEVTTCAYEQDVEVSCSEVGNNVLCIQGLDPCDIKDLN